MSTVDFKLDNFLKAGLSSCPEPRAFLYLANFLKAGQFLASMHYTIGSGLLGALASWMEMIKSIALFAVKIIWYQIWRQIADIDTVFAVKNIIWNHICLRIADIVRHRRQKENSTLVPRSQFFILSYWSFPQPASWTGPWWAIFSSMNNFITPG